MKTEDKSLETAFKSVFHIASKKMYLNTKIRLNFLLWCWVAFFAVPNFKIVQSVIFRLETGNDTCEPITYSKEQMNQCVVTLRTNELSERLMLKFNQLQLNCTDTLFIYDGPSVTGSPAFELTCKNQTAPMIYSTNNSVSLELITSNDLGFESKDFYLAYTPFNESKNGCNDGYVCQDENKYCIPGLYWCDGYYHCSDDSDEDVKGGCVKYDDGDDTIKLIALACFVGFLLLLGSIWLCAHTRKVMRNRAAIQRYGVVYN